MNKCNYCGKEYSETKGAVELYAAGEKTAAYCSADCMGKAFNKTMRKLKHRKQ